MKIYLYNKITGEFLKESIAILNLEKSRIANTYVYDYPENCTTIAPPKLRKFEQAIFSNGNWVIKEDYRNQKFYDPINNKTVVIKELGQVPENYLLVGSLEFNQLIGKLDVNLLRNSIKQKIEELFESELESKVIIDKYLFLIKDFYKIDNTYNTNNNYIQELQNNIEKINECLSTTYDIELKNSLIKQQLDLYKLVENYEIEVVLKNKRNKEITVNINFNKFRDIYLQLKDKFNHLESVKENLFNKLKFIKDENLIIFEQRLCDKGLFVYEKARDEKVSKIYRKTS